VALDDTGSVSAAAKKMHVSQPTASMQLKEVTQSVGLPLYEVISRKIHLTEVGQELAVTARSMAQAWDTFEQNVDAIKGLSRGKLRVAVVSTAKYFMPRIIGSFCTRYPAIDVSLEILNRDGVVQRLRDNLDDLYIMSMPPADMDLEDEAFMPNPIVVIASANDPLTERHSVPLHELASRRFILREKAQEQGWRVIYFSGKRSFSPMSALSWAATKPSKSPSLPVWVSVWCQAIACMDFKKSTVSALWMSLAFPYPQPGTLFTLEAKKCRR
jgi:DNA-binding transcriptional LysR family regulator